MASSFFSNLVTTNPLEVEIVLKDAHQLPQTMGHDENGHPEVQYLYTATDLISGTCTVKLKQKNKVDHLGIKIELIGQVELSADKGQPYEFTSLVRELEGLGELTENKSYSFEFANVDKSYETYHGNNVRLRYFLRVKVARQVWPLTKTLDFQVQNIGSEPDSNASIKMEVGIEDWSVPLQPLTAGLSCPPLCSASNR
jgi:vacuolar protein sorting-associated protein 26